jgi:hypothetical protein
MASGFAARPPHAVFSTAHIVFKYGFAVRHKQGQAGALHGGGRLLPKHPIPLVFLIGRDRAILTAFLRRAR